jgi:hypothetical protein
MVADLRMDRIHVALFTPGYPFVDAALRAFELSRRDGARFSRSIGEPLSLNRDRFARAFIDTEATHALLLEGDIVPPEDVLDRLLAAGAPIVTAAYPQWVDERLSTNVQAVADRTWSDTIPARVFPVRRCLLGCVLVRREVFTAVHAPWFLSTMTATRFVTDDEWFCDVARRAGQRILCDGTVICRAFRQGADLLALAGGHMHRP